EFRRRARVTPDEMQLRDRDVQLVTTCILDREELAVGAADVQFQQSLVTTDAMVDMHDRRADRELGKVADDRLGIARGTLAAARLLRALAEQLAFGQYGDRRFVEDETGFARRDRDGEPRRRVRIRADELVPSRYRLRL